MLCHDRKPRAKRAFISLEDINWENNIKPLQKEFTLNFKSLLNELMVLLAQAGLGASGGRANISPNTLLPPKGKKVGNCQHGAKSVEISFINYKISESFGIRNRE